MTLKNTIYFIVVAFLSGAIIGGVVVYKTSPKVKKNIIKQNVKPEIHGVVKTPVTAEEKTDALQADIIVTRAIEGDVYSGYATNGYKFTSWSDKISTPVTSAKWAIQADIFGGVVDKKFFIMYGASANYFYNDRVYFNAGGASAPNGAGIVHAGVGLQFF